MRPVDQPLRGRNRGPLMPARGLSDSRAQTPSWITRASLASAVASFAERFARVASAADPGRRVPATAPWTVQDVTAHLITAVDRYAHGPTSGMQRAADPADLPALNERLLKQHDRAAFPDLLCQLQGRIHELLRQVEGYGDVQPSYLFNADRLVRADKALGILAGELAVHGGDIADADGEPWPVAATDAEMILYGLEQVLPGWVHPRRGRGHCATYEIRVRGTGERHIWSFRDGHLDCHADPGGPFDCHLSASPAALLKVVYRRQSPWRAALAGEAVAWGRQPWLALSLPGRFHPP